MSDRVPFHIQEEIIRRLPVKPLIQFRSVSKAWKSLIDSSEFIVAHSDRHTQQQHLIVWFFDPIKEIKFVCYVDDDTFPQQRFVPTLPPSVKLADISKIIGSSHGLLCLNAYCWQLKKPSRMAVLWNPSIRKSIVVAVPEKILPVVGQESLLGFGVCPLTHDPKIIDIIHYTNKKIIEPTDLWEVKVFTLSSGKWRSLSSNLPNKSIQATSPKLTQAVVDRFIYWCAFRTMSVDGGLQLQTHNLIMSFDITNEQFEVVDLPDSLACLPPTQLSISNVRESVIMLEYSIKAKKHVCDVWMMEINGVQRLFTKLYTIKPPHWSIRTLGFSKSGQPVVEMKDDVAWMLEQASLSVYDPNTQHMNDLGLRRLYGNYYVNLYTETLLLLDRADGSRY